MKITQILNQDIINQHGQTVISFLGQIQITKTMYVSEVVLYEGNSLVPNIYISEYFFLIFKLIQTMDNGLHVIFEILLLWPPKTEATNIWLNKVSKKKM